MNNQVVDVIVLGGGIIGLTCAHLLATLDLRVAVIEIKDLNQAFSTSKILDGRCSAISYASESLLRDIHVWDALSLRVSMYQHMCVSDTLGNQIDFSAAEVPASALGHIVDNHILQQSLWERLILKTNVKVLSPMGVKDLNFSQNQVIVTLNNGEQIISGLLIGAEGRDSWLREKMGIALHRYNYQQTALSAKIVTEKCHQKTAWQRFTDKGPLAFLPLADPHHCSVVWSIHEKYVDNIFALSNTALCEKIAVASQYRLGQVEAISDRQRFPLYRLQAAEYVRERMVLLGDAAHVIHPMIGQGINLSFLNMRDFFKVITQALAKNQDIGSYEILRSYERAAKYRVFEFITAVESLKYLFEANKPLVSLMRKIGLNITRNLPYLKRIMMRYAMGLTDREIEKAPITLQR